MIRLLLLTLLALTAIACENNHTGQGSERKHQHAIFTFGTVIDITILDADDATAEQIFSTLDNDFAYWHKAWNPWLSGPLARVNSLLPTKAAFSMPLHVVPLIQQSQALYEQSEGLFNPAIGNLINLWKFHEYKDKNKQPPTEDEIRSVVEQQPKMSDLQLSNIELQSNNKHVQLNFGAFAKGYAIELSMKTLKQFGIKNAVINAGGDLKVIGQHQDRLWRIGVRHPRIEQAVIASIDVADGESVFTSGDYERYFFYQGQRYNHILDPRSGYPANKSQSVTVIHDDAGIADAAATALFVAGPQDWYRIAKKMGIKYVMLVDAKGTIHMNPAMAARIQLSAEQQADIKLSDVL